MMECLASYMEVKRARISASATSSPDLMMSSAALPRTFRTSFGPPLMAVASPAAASSGEGNDCCAHDIELVKASAIVAATHTFTARWNDFTAVMATPLRESALRQQANRDMYGTSVRVFRSTLADSRRCHASPLTASRLALLATSSLYQI